MKGDRPSYPKETVDLTVALPYHAWESPKFHECKELSLGLWQTGTAPYGHSLNLIMIYDVWMQETTQRII